MENKTILQKLEYENVVSFYISKDKKLLEVEECTDYCFSLNLSKTEALQLIEELKELVNLMEYDDQNNISQDEVKTSYFKPVKRIY